MYFVVLCRFKTICKSTTFLLQKNTFSCKILFKPLFFFKKHLKKNIYIEIILLFKNKIVTLQSCLQESINNKY